VLRGVQDHEAVAEPRELPPHCKRQNQHGAQVQVVRCTIPDLLPAQPARADVQLQEQLREIISVLHLQRDLQQGRDEEEAHPGGAQG
jgi:hypothetical protein